MSLELLGIPRMIEAAPANVLRAMAVAQIAADKARKIFDEHIVAEVALVIEQK